MNRGPIGPVVLGNNQEEIHPAGREPQYCKDLFPLKSPLVSPKSRVHLANLVDLYIKIHGSRSRKIPHKFQVFPAETCGCPIFASACIMTHHGSKDARYPSTDVWKTGSLLQTYTPNKYQLDLNGKGGSK